MTNNNYWYAYHRSRPQVIVWFATPAGRSISFERRNDYRYGQTITVQPLRAGYHPKPHLQKGTQHDKD